RACKRAGATPGDPWERPRPPTDTRLMTRRFSQRDLQLHIRRPSLEEPLEGADGVVEGEGLRDEAAQVHGIGRREVDGLLVEIGRASCRERGWRWVVSRGSRRERMSAAA